MDKSLSVSTIRPFVSQSRRYAAGILATCLSTWAGLSIPWIIRDIIDDLAAGRSSAIVPLIILAGLVRFAGMRFKRFGILGASVRLEEEFRNTIHDKVMDAPHRAFAGFRTGDLASRLTRDLEAVSAFWGQGVYDLVSTVIRMISALVLMLVIDPLLTLVALAPLFILAATTKHFSRYFHERFRIVQEDAGNLSGKIHDAVKSIRAIKAEQLEPLTTAEFEKTADRFTTRQIDLAWLQSLLLPAVISMVGAAGVLMLLAGGVSARAGRISLGDFTAFYVYLSMLLWPVVSLGLAFAARERSLAASSRIEEILEKTAKGDPAGARSSASAAVHSSEEEAEESDAGSAPPLLTCEYIRYTYPGAAKPALRGVSLRLEPGEKVLLAGTTASGKSTLFSILGGNLTPDRGTVKTDRNQELSREPDTASRIGLLSGYPYIFSGSVEWNITAGEDGRPPVGRLLELSGLDRETERWKRGAAREVGSRGGLLSGGQRQRLGLARFLSIDFGIWLLDDPFSFLDGATEAALLEELWKIAEDRTILLASRSKTAAALADRIIVLHQGRIVEEGTHQSLLEGRGLYCAIMELGK